MCDASRKRKWQTDVKYEHGKQIWHGETQAVGIFKLHGPEMGDRLTPRGACLCSECTRYLNQATQCYM